MSLDLAFTPAGHVTAVELTAEQAVGFGGESQADGRLKKVVKAFAGGQGEGLFLLATERFDGPLPASFSYWRDFAARYLTALCHTPDGGAKLDVYRTARGDRSGDAAHERAADAGRRVSERSRVGRRMGRPGHLGTGRGDRRRRGTIRIPEAAGAAVAPGGASLLPFGRESAK